jgi:hypothetical protein
MKTVLHDWSDEYSLKILKRLRGAAAPDTKLVCVELVLSYACHDAEEDSGDGLTDLAPIKAQKPLLANWGAVNCFIYLADISVCLSSQYSSQCLHRHDSCWLFATGANETIRQFDRLSRSAGWKITAVRRPPGVDLALFSSIVAVQI